MTQVAIVNHWEQQIQDNLKINFSQESLPLLHQKFKREGFIKVPEIMPLNIRQQMKEEALRLLEKYSERRDLKLATTGNTPRKMSVVTSESIAADSEFINTIYRSKSLLNFLEKLAGEPFLPCPSKDEEFLITRHEKSGDTHGWHWGDYRFALIWILETPPIEYGGMLQCVPHTNWDKSNPRIHEYLCENPIRTYGFVSGDIYLLKSDTTLHRTVPLNRDATRIMINMTWGCLDDEKKNVNGNDRWWAEKEVEAGTYT
jgi:L-lysine 4-chlorinase